MQHADAFRYLIGVLAEAEPKLKELVQMRYQKGYLLVRTVLLRIARSFFNGFGSNLAKNVTSEARKEKLSGPEECRREYDWEDGRPMNRKEYKRRKVTSAYKSWVTSHSDSVNKVRRQWF